MGRDNMNKDPRQRRQEGSRARQGLQVEYKGTHWEVRLQSYCGVKPSEWQALGDATLISQTGNQGPGGT